MPHLRLHGPPPKPPVKESSSQGGQGPQVSTSSPLPTPNHSPQVSPPDSPPCSPTSRNQDHINLEPMADRRQTVHQQATHGFTGLASPITVPPIVNENSWQIPSYAMQAITNNIQFHGREDEDAPAHVNRFSRILATFRLQGASIDAIYLQLFPFSLAGRAATWLDSQPTGTFTTWEGLRQAFLNKYFPPAKASRLRDQIHSFYMEPDEPYYLAWERFQNLVARCSQHGLTD